MNVLELALKCHNGDCNYCPYYHTVCKEFMRLFELAPSNLIAMLKWSPTGEKTMLDVAVQCYSTSKCAKCDYKESDRCPMSQKIIYAPEDLLEELFKEVKNDNS